MFAPIKMNNYRSNFLNNNPFMLMCKHFNDLSSKVDYFSSYFVVKNIFYRVVYMKIQIKLKLIIFIFLTE